MSLISRASGEPYVDGETLTGAELEGDIAALFDAVNGNIDADNLADDSVTTAKLDNEAVTTGKLDDAAVTKAKLADGAATASETDLTATSVAITSGTYATLGAAITHAVSSDPRHVIIIASMRLQNANNNASEAFIKIQKDGVDLLAANADEAFNLSTLQDFSVTRMWIDDNPTPSATHTYRVQAKITPAATINFHNVQVLVFEPRR